MLKNLLRGLVAAIFAGGLLLPAFAGDFVMPGERAQQRHLIPPPNGSVGVLVVTGGANTRPQTVAPGTSGNVLQSNGAAWIAAPKGETLLCDNTLGSAQTNMDCGSLPTTYNMFRVEIIGAGITTGTGITVNLSLSSDGGSTFEAQTLGGNSAGTPFNANVWISVVGLTAKKLLTGVADNGSPAAIVKTYSTKTSPTNYVRFSYASSTVISGSRMRVFGIN